MDIAALILSIMALIMSCVTMITYLSAYVFSKREIQFVPADSVVGGQKMGRPMEENFEEFDMAGPMDAADAVPRSAIDKK